MNETGRTVFTAIALSTDAKIRKKTFIRKFLIIILIFNAYNLDDYLNKSAEKVGCSSKFQLILRPNMIIFTHFKVKLKQ